MLQQKESAQGRHGAPVVSPKVSSQIRLRAFIIGAALIFPDNYWVVAMERVYTGPYPTIISLFANAIFILALISLINSALKKISPANVFSSAEMLLIYTMIAIGASLAGLDMIPSLVMCMCYPWWFATPENNFAGTFLPYLPKWLTVSDKDALQPLYSGGSSLYRYDNWSAWFGPMLCWLAFIVVLLFVMMCINTLVRKQWVERERLTFPIVQLPVAMTEPKGEVWRSKLFWIGFAITFSIDLINGLAVYYPNIPAIPVDFRNHDLSLVLSTKPWNAIGWTPYTFYPFVIGLGYLLPADLSFSCWFFYIYWKLQLVITNAMAWDSIPDFPYIRHQAFGGYVAIILVLTWTSRGYLKQIWLRLIGQKSELDDSDEPMRYKTAVIGAILGVLFLSMSMKSIGMSPLVAVAAFLIYFILATAIARMRAELGPPVHDLHFSGPDYMITTSAGLNKLSGGDFVGLTYFYWFNRAYRGHPMPIGIEGMKMAQITKSSQRKFLFAIMLAALLGGFAAFWAYLDQAYRLGLAAKVHGQSAFAVEAFNNLSKWWARPNQMSSPNWGANFAMIQGFVVCALLGYARLRIFSFPFHPIGYAISGSWSMNLVWLPILIAWALKVVTLRYGGLKLYKELIPLFLGLILGEMIMGSLWSLIGLAFNIPYYNFWGT